MAENFAKLVSKGKRFCLYSFISDYGRGLAFAFQECLCFGWLGWKIKGNAPINVKPVGRGGGEAGHRAGF